MSQSQFISPPPEIINIHEAKTHLSRIVEEVKTYGKPVIIAKAGKPQVQITPLQTEFYKRQMGTLKNQIRVPDDFDTMFADEIVQMFEGA
ncbi:type II toxin-antitoxin system Phd/YefM family antitoxin [Wielerella bovis]|uniref:type II toxin-antitoxin system Phd/YefM family antitoxin n=1 Tax=Wielerella bovis TaxID=2917790 RepID=UPI002019CAAF|nr:type II toxin-antitoxin system prevent-host-death family antitoxin [Wielerella bovis]ULJ67841.1 type II toxin-antitoxin system prevent-host-death family antitoxin [Wielerella bovis]